MAGIYVHIPFCASRCLYCDFYSTVGNGRARAFAEALKNEWEVRRELLNGEPVKTVYLGGGTPSQLPHRVLRQILDLLPVDEAVEVTIEANPDDVTSDFARFLSNETPVNRVSMGVQSLIDTELRRVGRRHTAHQARCAVEALHRAGISNISLDLIYGLPGQTLHTWQQSIDGVLELQPRHLSAYILSYEEGTPLWRQRQRGMLTEAPDSLIEQMYGGLLQSTRAAGFEHYEISNFALPGYRSRHNSAYWTSTPYLGLGPGAHSYLGGIRSYNPGNLQQYISNLGVTSIEEHETADNRYNDLLITALRTAEGLNLDHTGAFRNELLHAAAPHLHRGTLLLDGNHLRVAEEAWLLTDAILLDLIR